MSADHAEIASAPSSQTDRRRRYRAGVHWPVQFHRPGVAEPLATETENLSSDGFYCRLNAAFSPGDIADCTLQIQAYSPLAPERMLAVECRVRVVRVDGPDLHGLHGIGCRIENYRFPSPAPPRT